MTHSVVRVYISLIDIHVLLLVSFVCINLVINEDLKSLIMIGPKSLTLRRIFIHIMNSCEDYAKRRAKSDT